MKMIPFIDYSLTYGPIYAAAACRITSKKELDPVENWEYWTKPRSELLERLFRSYPGERRRRTLINRKLWEAHSKGIEYHYDVSNRFYGCFLDTKHRFYTCARFLSEDETIEEAQTNKGDYLMDLLEPRRGEEIRELGCGWGGGLSCIAERTGTREGLIGYTLSKQQYQYCIDLGFNVQLEDFIEKDYEPESIDSFINIGSLEHVRPTELTMFYNKIFRALRPRGRLVSQFFSLNHEPLPPSMLWAQLFFPGSILAMHETHESAARAAGFQIVSDVTDCYKRTLRAWYDNLVSNREEAVLTSGVKTYNQYLTFFPMAWRLFHDGDATLHRMLLIKQ